MGIPAFFRWLARKYPHIREPADEHVLDVETRQEIFTDNLYLDMNGIIHPCTHPENKPPPQTEEDMFIAIFEYTEMIMNIVKPRNLLYLAIDGVAPRAKMNQQRSRRFRAARESDEKNKIKEEIREKLRQQGIAPQEQKSGSSFDSNVITPGTNFMKNLSVALQKWIKHKLSQHDESGLWHKDLRVIISDASVPGEGEHKIMDYLRNQKFQPNYDENLRHCLYGADADLIMLGLATHEKHFVILREEFKPGQPRPCELCNQYGHELENCQGINSIEDASKRPLAIDANPEFIYIKLTLLRNSLLQDMEKSSFYDLTPDRYIDDFVFLCFFVGNDFLPHLPSLEIRENAIDLLLNIYHDLNKKNWVRGLYLTDNGNVNLQRCQEILEILGPHEERIFRKRKISDERYQQRIRAEKKAKWQLENNNYNYNDYPEPQIPDDFVRLGEDGWKARYYTSKFGCEDYEPIAKLVTEEYIRGLCWVLAYYYQGCPDWKWFFPFHYAPFASDMKNITEVSINFDKEAPPFKPLEQLMAVFPAASASALPKTWRNLMSDQNSNIIDFYPINFTIDLNGKSAAWMGTALLPFIDEQRLFDALKDVYPDLNEEEKTRNSLGSEFKFGF